LAARAVLSADAGLFVLFCGLFFLILWFL